MKKKKYLDVEEKELIESLENDTWVSAKDLEDWKNHLSKTAANTLRKDQRMNIRISQNDLDRIKLKAIEEGLPY